MNTRANSYQIPNGSDGCNDQHLDLEQWTKHYDESLSAYYYYNHETGVSQWEQPLNIEKEDNQVPLKQKPMKKTNPRNSKIIPLNDSDQPTSSDHSAVVAPAAAAPPLKTADKKEGGVGVEEEESDQPKQNYLALAKIYEIQKPYRDYHSKILCVLCHKNQPERVLYPCQHRAICDQCLESESICSLDQMNEKLHGFCNCPLCGTILKRILPADEGREEEIYWNWVLEVKPPLPDNFMKNFRHSAAIIQKIHIDENQRVNQQMERRKKRMDCCLIS
jgi:hypothetical protein